MPRPSKRYFLVKHDLASLTLLPGYIWNSINTHSKIPPGFRQVREGDEWISFAYTANGERKQKLSHATGFYRCIQPLTYGLLPASAQTVYGPELRGWHIIGMSVGTPLQAPVEIPPLGSFFNRELFPQRTVTEITRAEFDRIRNRVLDLAGLPRAQDTKQGPKYIEAAEQGVFAKEARESLHQLVHHVLSLQGRALTPITYEELAFRIGRLNKHGKGHGHGMGKVLGVMGHTLQRLSGDWGEQVPMIQCLVVNKAGPLRGLPDVGIKEFWSGYKRWSREEKRDHVLQEYRRIENFGSRWNQVLAKLKLQPVAPPTHKQNRFGRGGESPEHRRLQEFVRRHPELVGAEANWSADENYSLPSLDEIDLLFRSAGSCIAVEVKSKISDRVPEDYERGIYQTIKYAAILSAMHRAGRKESRSTVESVLVLEGTLPEQYRPLAKRLGVRVLENVNPAGE